MKPTSRPDISRVTSAELAPIEALLTADWCDVWRDFARSYYRTLIIQPRYVEGHEEAAHLAVALLMDVVQNMGGTQPYITIGEPISEHEKSARVRELARLTSADVESIKSVSTAMWNDVWRDLDSSHYRTLISNPRYANAHEEAARLAVTLLLGVAQDLGGTQPYISRGKALDVNKKSARVLELLAQGQKYKDVAAACALTTMRVRQIESAHIAQRAKARAI